MSVPIKTNDDIPQTVMAIATELGDPTLRGIFILGSGLNINFAMLIKQLQAQLGDNVVITGGISGDGDRFERTWVLKDDTFCENHVVVVGLYGDAIRINYGSQGGWQPTGLPMLITRSKDNILYKLNGLSALQWYRFQLRASDVALPAGALYHPLAVRPSAYHHEYVVRTILGVDEENQGLIFAGEIPERSFAQFMIGSTKQLISGARYAATYTNPEKLAQLDSLAVAISCVGRRLVMGQTTEDELSAVIDILPNNTKLVGFYSYGEICPNSTQNSLKSALHNQTMTLTLFSECLEKDG